MLRVGIIGFGKMGMLHAGIVNSMSDVELAAVTDMTSVVLNALKLNKPSVAVYENYIEMLNNEHLDAVFITTPTFLHVPMALECVNRRIHFFVEKPLGISCEDARPLLESLKREKIINMVGYMGRCIETFTRAREILKAGVLGDIVAYNATMYVSQLFKRGKGWRYKKENSGGGVVITQNSHLIDLLIWYFGEVKAVNGFTRSYYSSETEDFAHAYLEFKDGVTGWFDASWSVRHHRMVEISLNIEAENGTLMVNDDEVRLFLEKPAKGYQEGWTTYTKPELFSGVEIDVGGPQYTRQDRHFVDAVIQGNPTDCDVKTAYRAQEVTDAIYESAKNGGNRVVLGKGRLK
jgi:predicted dehydrogenase